MNGILFILIISLIVTMFDSYEKKRYRNLRKSNLIRQNTPPHCTQIIKHTGYQARFKYDYPITYIQSGQHEAYQQLFCVNPRTVNKAATTVCDWAAPPLVQFALGDQYVYVLRQDPSGRFLGNAVITTYQYCYHDQLLDLTSVVITPL